jgi:hypothetical protein
LTLSAQQIALAVADEEITTDCSPKMQAVKEGRCPDGYCYSDNMCIRGECEENEEGEKREAKSKKSWPWQAWVVILGGSLMIIIVVFIIIVVLVRRYRY